MYTKYNIILYVFCNFPIDFGTFKVSLISCGLCRDKAVKYLLATISRCLKRVADNVLFATSQHSLRCSFIDKWIHPFKSVNAEEKI